MRELKFRLWSKRTNRYITTCIVDGVEYNEISAFDLFGLRSDAQFQSDVIIEQYTGLKDKNGKEIYEGDIVGDIEGIHELAICVWDDSNAEFDFVCVDGKCTKDNVKSWLEMYEIIGNIHENGELLENE